MKKHYCPELDEEERYTYLYDFLSKCLNCNVEICNECSKKITDEDDCFCKECLDTNEFCCEKCGRIGDFDDPLSPMCDSICYFCSR